MQGVAKPLRQSANSVFVAPAIFTQDGMPRGPAAARHADTPGMPVVTGQAPALPGEWIALFLTGLGVRNPMIMAPEILPAVRLGELQAEVGYSGAAPGFPGLNQINFKVPPASPPGQLPLTVSVGSVQSITAAMAVGRSN